jgi:hypothetical protein
MARCARSVAANNGRNLIAIIAASFDATDRRAKSLVRRTLLGMIDDPTPP